MNKILIIEDDISIAEIERDFLEISGYATTVIADGLKGMEEAISCKYDLILLDLMLPNMDGFEICRRIRNSIDIPILMVTAKIEDVDKVRGLGLGADDYIAKPFSPTELVARVKANIAQNERLKNTSCPENTTCHITLGRLRINTNARRVYLNEEEIECKNKEYELLLFLVSNPEIVFSKEHLYVSIWGMDAYGDIKTVAVHINRLREKIEQDPKNPTCIETVWGAGYRFKI